MVITLDIFEIYEKNKGNFTKQVTWDLPLIAPFSVLGRKNIYGWTQGWNYGHVSGTR